MGEIIQFASKAERERARLVREARALYDAIFPASELADVEFVKSDVDVASSRNRCSREEEPG
jgi:hypothetical protein